MNLSLGHVKGIKIQIHFTFWIIVIWGAFRYGGLDNIKGMIYGASLTLMLFGIVLLHELGHSFAALRFGIPVRDITLLPIGGVARLERMPEKPIQELIVAIAGPAVNVVLAFLFLPVIWLLIEAEMGFRWFINNPNLAWTLIIREALSSYGLFGIVAYLFAVNLTLLIFNMIPAFPLDGGRVFRALMAFVLGFERATRIAVWVGRLFAIALGIYGLRSGNYLTAFIAVFIFTAGGAEGRAVVVRTKLRGISVRQALSRVGSTILQPNFTMTEVASLTLYSHQINFPVMLGDALVGVVRRQDIRQEMEQGNTTATVSEVMRRNIPHLSAESSLVEAQEQLVQTNCSVAAVYEEHRFIGLLSFEDIERAFNTFTRRGPAPQAA